MKSMKVVMLFAAFVSVISIIYAADGKHGQPHQQAKPEANVHQQRANVIHGRTPSMSQPAKAQAQHLGIPQHNKGSPVHYPNVVTPMQHNVRNAKLQNFRQGATNRNIAKPVDQHRNAPSVNRQHAGRINNQFKNNNPNHKQWFSDNFYRQHNYRPNYAGYGWRGSNWNQIAGWGDWGWSNPIYYSDGGESYYVSPNVDNTVITNDYSTNDYSSNVYNVQNDYSQQAPIQGDWLPLGVFAAGMDTMQAAYSNMVVQLALNKNGEIAGTYYNAASDETHPLEGMVDRDSQMAYWRVADKDDSTIISAGLYNLTQDVVNVQVHFANGSDQNWVFVRLNEAEGN